MELKDGRWGKWWTCPNWPACKHAVGCHPGTADPLGTPADPETRQWRHRAHEVFDRLWQGPQAKMSRQKAYRLLQRIMGLSEDEAHVGMFNKDQCQTLIRKLRRLQPD